MGVFFQKTLVNFKKAFFGICPNNRKFGLFFVSLVVFFCVFGFLSVYAQTDESMLGGAAGDFATGIMWGVAKIALGLGELFLRLAIFLLKFFIDLASFNDYVDITIVMLGWTMVRDVANMFFVVVLLVIAVGTILGIEQYQWNKTLAKLILAAIFINFSNLICGILIDIAQVFTMTFVNAIAATSGGNMINMFHMGQMFTLVSDSDPNAKKAMTTDMNIRLLASSIAAFLFAFLAMVSIAAYAVAMLVRVVVLWILIILSPIAFIAQVIPQGQSYANEWWSEFGKHVMVAPVIVFFLWLAFATAGDGQLATNMKLSTANPGSLNSGEWSSADFGSDSAASLVAVTKWSNMANVLVPVAILWVGLERAQKMGVKGGEAMGKAGDMFKSVASTVSGLSFAKGAFNKGVEGISKGAKWTGKQVLMRAPLVGGRAWQRRGAWFHEQGLGLAEKWNNTVGGWTGLQFGAHEKIMKERKAAIEAMQGKVSSSAKGWAPTKGIDKLKSHVNRLQGEQEIRKGNSEAKRAMERDRSAIATIRDPKTGALTEQGKKFANRSLEKQRAATDKDTTMVGAQLEILVKNSGGIADKYYKTLADNKAVQSAFVSAKKLGVETVEEEEHQEERKELEEHQKEALAASSGDTQKIEAYESQEAVVGKAEKDKKAVSAEEARLNKEITDHDLAVQSKTAERDALLAEINDPNSTLTDDEKKQKQDDVDRLNTEISNENAQKDEKQNQLAAIQALAEQKQGVNTQKMEELLQKILDVGGDTSKATAALGKIRSDQDLSDAFKQFYGRDVGGVDEKFIASQDSKTLRALLDVTKDKRDGTSVNAQKYLQDNKGEYKESRDKVGKIKKQVLEKMAKSGKYANIAAAYYEVLANQKSIYAHGVAGGLKNQVAQNAIFDEFGIPAPSDSITPTVNDLRKSLDGMEKESLSSAFRFLSQKITQLANDMRPGSSKGKTKGEEYRSSAEFYEANLMLKALGGELHKTRYWDDQVGNATELTEEKIKDLAKKYAQENGVDESTVESAIRDTMYARKERVPEQASGGKINWEVKVNEIKNGSSGQSLLDFIKVLKQSSSKFASNLGDQTAFGAQDILDIENAMISYFKSNQNSGLNQKEISEMIRKSLGDADLAKIVKSLF